MPSCTVTMKHSTLALLLALLGAPCASAVTVNANPANYLSLLPTLKPGDTLALASGAYSGGLSLTGMAGTAAHPIVISGPQDQSAVFAANACCNVVQLDATSYLEVDNLTLDGTNLDGPFGVDGRNASHDITLDNLKIINFGANQQDVGISTKGSAWNWTIRHNTIIAAGTGMYFGNSDGSDPFVNGLVEYNLIVNTVGYNIEVKQQNPRPTDVGLPTGTSRTIIRHNVFSKQSNASTGGEARPNLLVGHFPLTGIGAGDLYEIYGNFFYQNPTEALFQGEGNIALHDNVFVTSAGDAIHIQPQNDLPRNVTVYDNTVVASGAGISITGGDPNYVQRIIGNAAFAASPVTGPNQTNNITASYAAAATFLNAPYAPIGSLDAFPLAGQLSGAAMDLSAYAGFTDGTLDFNGSARNGIHRGAYEGAGTNGGWQLALAIMPVVGGIAAPTVGFSATPTQVSLQGSSSLQWSVDNATSCNASGAWTGTEPLSGSESVGPLSADATYTLTCSGPGGSTVQSVTVAVVTAPAAPTVSFTASPTTITSGSRSSLSWHSTAATSCSGSGAWSGSQPLSGIQSVGPLTSNSTYTLTCTGAGGSAAESVTVAVTAASVPPTLSSSPPPPAGTTSAPQGGGGRVDAILLLCLLTVGAARSWARWRT
jgi:hypothetical protein